jgi:hypothetical protein
VTTEVGLDKNPSYLGNHSRVESEQTNGGNTYNGPPSQAQIGQIRDDNNEDFRLLLKLCYPDIQGQGLAQATRNINVPQTAHAGHFNNSTVVTNDTRVS